jgi:glyoxylase-like metal-dependent hydrolase (beta-lactamase superfamily II)
VLTNAHDDESGLKSEHMDIEMCETLMQIKQDMPGFDHFFGSWVSQGEINIVVDAGPASAAAGLVESLDAMGVNTVDYVFLTHLHIDHCGGLAELLDHYPMAKVICHENGLKYLPDPSKLWTASLAALGDVAEAYGPPKPVAKERIIPHKESNLKDLVVLETPGHAAHHLSFSYRNRLFAGEAGGNYLVVDGTEYLRPATPPRFFFDVCVQSIDKLLSMEDQPIYYAHFDRAESSHRLLRMFRDQLMQWKRVIYDQMQKDNDDLVRRCMDTLLAKDPNLKAFESMDTYAKKRERFFMVNSIKGFIGFFHGAA